MSTSPTAASYWLPAHVRGCTTGAGAVLLDLQRNRYFGVGRREKDVLTHMVGNWSSSAAPDADTALEPAAATRIAESLVTAGLLVRAAPAGFDLTAGEIDLSQTLASIGLEMRSRAPLQPGHLANFLRACLWAGRALRRRSLYSIAIEVSEWKRSATTPFDQQRAIDFVSRFRRLRPLAFAARDQCLFHALALVKFLATYDIHPSWVIGVRLRPWAAHSWVQRGRLLFDSNPEAVCDYSPILVV